MANSATFTVDVKSDTDIIANLAQGNTITADVVIGGQGPQGETGPQGPPGPTGATGPGVPVGGNQGQYLVKLTNNDYETYWATQQAYRGVDFNAVGDGVVDDTAAIQAMLDAAHGNGGGLCQLASGVFKITSPLTTYTSVILQGISPEATIISQVTANTDGIVANDASSVGLVDIQIRGTGAGTGKGINFTWTLAGNNPYHTFRNVIVKSFGSDNIYIRTPIVSTFDKVVSWLSGENGFNWYQGGTSCLFRNCWARQNGKSGYRFFESVYQNLSGCAADNNGINYEIVDAQGIAFVACGSEGALQNDATYNGYGWKIDNSSVVSLDSCWVTDNRNRGVWVTNNSQAIALRVADNTPNGTATNFIKTDSGTNGSIYELHNTTANSIAGNWNTYNDGSGGTRTKDIYIENATATTVPYLNANKAIVSSAVTPTELGYLSGVTSAIQTQLGTKIATNDSATLNSLTVTSGTLAAGSSNHLALSAGTNKLVKSTVLRQDNTTDTYQVGNTVRLTGWGVFAQAATSSKSETVTFGITFAATPIVNISYGGDQTGGVIALGNGGNTVKGPVTIKAYGESTTGFTAHAHTADGTAWGATDNVYYKWTAEGEI